MGLVDELGACDYGFKVRALSAGGRAEKLKSAASGEA